MTPHPLAQRAQQAVQRGDLQDAVSALDELLRLAPQDHDAWHVLAMVQVRLGNAGLALPAIGHAVALDRHNAEYFNTQGVVLAESGAPQEAVASFRESIRLRPTHANAHYNLGKAQQKCGRFDEAIDEIGRAHV